jgi:hypothetical protein
MRKRKEKKKKSESRNLGTRDLVSWEQCCSSAMVEDNRLSFAQIRIAVNK